MLRDEKLNNFSSFYFVSHETIAPQLSPARPSETTVPHIVHDKTPLSPTYDLSEQSLRDMQGLQAFRGAPIADDSPPKTGRRNALRILGGSALAVATYGGGELYRLFDAPINIPENPSSHYEPLTNGEPIGEFVLSFVDSGKAYISLDEIRDLVGQGDTVDIHIDGSDMEQYYKASPTHKDASGIDIVKRDGFTYVRFTIRPSDTTQAICTSSKNAEFIQPIDSMLQEHESDGTTSLYFEGEPRLLPQASQMQQQFDKLRFLFPNCPPFITVRNNSKDEIISHIRANNMNTVPMEFIFNDEGLSHAFTETSIFTNYKKLTEALILSSMSSPDVQEKVLAAANAIDVKTYTLTSKHFGEIPAEWPTQLPRNIHNYIFHPAGYTTKIDADALFFSNTEHSLASLFYLLDDKARTEELLRRVNSLNKESTEGTTDFSNHYNDIRAIVGTCLEIARTTDKPGAEKAFPQMKRVYDELKLESFMQFQLPLIMQRLEVDFRGQN